MKKRYRLKKNHEIASVVHQKQKYYCNNYIVYYKSSLSNVPQIAISVSKKYGNAVERNYAKRVVREIVRPLIQEINNLLIVVVVKNSAKISSFEELKADLSNTLFKIKNKGAQSEQKKS